MALRKLRAAMAGKYDGRWAVDRERGVLRCGWTHILKLSAKPDDQPFDILYNDEGLSEVGIAKHEVRELVQSTIAPPPPPQWCL
eukprot:2643930-Pyramimonas_sp.AAC.1